MADCPALPCSLSLEFTELVTLPGIFFLDMTCRALLVVALLPVLFTRLLLELYRLLTMSGSFFTLELDFPLLPTVFAYFSWRSDYKYRSR